MREVIIALSVIGGALTVWSAFRLWRMDPDDSRYRNATLPGGGTTGGVARLISDQGRAALIAVAGGTLTLAALILTHVTGRG